MKKFVLQINKYISPSHNIGIFYTCITIIVAFVFYFIIPTFLNYPPFVVKNVKMAGLSYTQQYILIISFIIIINFIYLKYVFRNIDKWHKVNGQQEDLNNLNVFKLRQDCFNLPYHIYLFQIFFPPFVIGMIHFFIKTPFFLMLKTVLVFLFICTLIAFIVYIYAKKYFIYILLQTHKENNANAVRISLRTKIFLQVLPMFIIAILLTSLIGYSRLVEEKGNIMYKYYNSKLTNIINNNMYKDVEHIKTKLFNIEKDNNNIVKFIISPSGKIITSNNNLNKFFLDYMNKYAEKYNNRIYGITKETQGVMTKILINNKEWIVGVKYQVISQNLFIFFIISFIILLCLNAFVLIYFSQSLAEDISLVTNKLNEVAEGDNVNLNKKLPILSNDEISDLTIAFNNILELEKRNINEIEEVHNRLMERERLATLGELAGGVAHDINTPLSTIQRGLHNIERGLSKYEDDKTANAMKKSTQSCSNACTKIAEIVNSVRNHTRNLSGDIMQDIYIGDVVEEIQTLLHHQLKHSKCSLNFDEQDKCYIKGDSGKLEQVLTNLVVNAIQAYNDTPGEINIKTYKENGQAIISVSDNAGGIPQKYREGIFKKMLTTKGTEGTGLGLYMSYSIITGHFSGEMWFESEEGKGTTFYISIPINEDDN